MANTYIGRGSSFPWLYSQTHRRQNRHDTKQILATLPFLKSANNKKTQALPSSPIKSYNTGMSSALKRLAAFPDSFFKNSSKRNPNSPPDHKLYPELRQKRRDFRTFPYAAPSLSESFWLKPKLSIVVPVYNHSDFLAELLSSIVQNSPKQTEIIVIDDGSKDNFTGALEKFQNKEIANLQSNFKLKVYRQENKGISAALNFGFKNATGDFVCWQSADNLILNSGYSKLVDFLQANPSLVAAYGNMEVIDKDGKSIFKDSYRPQDLARPSSNKILLPYAASSLNVLPDNFMGSMFIYRNIPLFSKLKFKTELLGAEDYAFSLELGRFGRIAHIDSEDSLCAYRLHKNTLTVNLKQTHIQAKTKELIAEERKFSKILKAKKLKSTSTKILKSLKKRKKLARSFNLFGEKVTSKLSLLQEGSCLDILLGQNCYLDLSYKGQNLRVLPPLSLPPYLKKARDCYFRTFPLLNTGSSLNASLLVEEELGQKEESYLSNLLKEIPDLTINLIYLDTKIKQNKDIPNLKKFALQGRLNQISIDEELDSSKEAFFKSLLYILSSTEYLFSFQSLSSTSEKAFMLKKLNNRSLSALAAAAGLPLIYLGDKPTKEDFKINDFRLNLYGDYPFSFFIEDIFPSDKSKILNQARDSIDISSLNQWLLKRSTRTLRKEIKSFLGHFSI